MIGEFIALVKLYIEPLLFGLVAISFISWLISSVIVSDMKDDGGNRYGIAIFPSRYLAITKSLLTDQGTGRGFVRAVGVSLWMISFFLSILSFPAFVLWVLVDSGSI
ncbi:hypothetical protein [Phenylobacterium sp.]|uniref:hypothetical protein n=1 Tax=Phenylobacterium sp. TaxID=1871053 RepID=UPI0027358C67|nr:hypothetical protein [Phenylobacterium sp.]MDP3632376.1 hypothetical protein [Phenylobacterium sp.]